MRRRSPQEWTDDDIARLRSAWASRGTQGACAFDREFCETVQLRSGSVQRKRSELKLIAHPRRTTGIKPANAKRRRATHERNYGPRADLVRARGCEVHTKHWQDQAGWTETMIAAIEELGADAVCSGALESAHVVAQGMGGAKGSRRDQVCLCHGHAVMAGEHGTSARKDFEAMFKLDLDALAQEIAEDYDARGIP